MANNGENHEVEMVPSQPTPKKGKRKRWLDFIPREAGRNPRTHEDVQPSQPESHRIQAEVLLAAEHRAAEEPVPPSQPPPAPVPIPALPEEAPPRPSAVDKPTTSTGTTAHRWISQNKVPCGLIIGLIIALIIFIIFNVAYFASRQSSKSEQPYMRPPPLCPDDSIMYRKKCYYISKEESNWSDSDKACLSRNSSLARIEIDEEDFVKGIMQNEPFWIGLHKSFDQSWKWPNGENAKKPAGNGGDCAYLHGSEKVEAYSGRCNIPHRYICKFEVP